MATVVSKSVEELSLTNDEPPSEYIVRGCSVAPPDLSSSASSSPFPVIDVSLFSSSSSASDNRNSEVDTALYTLRSALSSTGCFQAIGHGMPSSFLDRVRETANQFFELPKEEKEKYARSINESEGYGSDRVVSENQVLDWSHRLTLRVFPQDKRRINLWPENPTDFSEILHEYSLKVKSMIDLLYKAMARSLNLEENSFSGQFGERALMQARFNFYPRCSRPDLVLGVKPHTDRSGITVLLQDREIEGLQILINDRWVRVPVIPDAFVINLGDQMQYLKGQLIEAYTSLQLPFLEVAKATYSLIFLLGFMEKCR
ncbi:codeine O-demethylase isoform X2 [Ricinus communis]|uniref:codeine O-demethylase isoform X2 n=1 Tax=Ricinus communis TaxID=3988 RepID=UPI000772A213|nr:codeine O-demethylase isoform X2 [Ricinus communis]|eukprot:XP_015583543.1 codeine O-demethylase isoform X2 [Ricinus communis]